MIPENIKPLRLLNVYILAYIHDSLGCLLNCTSASVVFSQSPIELDLKFSDLQPPSVKACLHLDLTVYTLIGLSLPPSFVCVELFCLSTPMLSTQIPDSCSIPQFLFNEQTGQGTSWPKVVPWIVDSVTGETFTRQNVNLSELPIR